MKLIWAWLHPSIFLPFPIYHHGLWFNYVVNETFALVPSGFDKKNKKTKETNLGYRFYLRENMQSKSEMPACQDRKFPMNLYITPVLFSLVEDSLQTL